MALAVPTRSEIGERVRSVRQKAGLTVRELAELIGSKDSGLISKIENGQKKIVDVSHLVKIANACAGAGELKDKSPEDILQFLMGQVDWLITARPKQRLVGEPEATQPESSKLTDWSAGIRVLRPIIGEISPDLGKAA